MIDRDPTPGAFRKRGRSESTLLVQPRPPRDSGYVVYGDALGAPEVHLHARVAEDLRSATVRALGHETIGVLLGRPCRDDYGTYVVVEHTVTADAGEHVDAPDSVSISAEGLASMRRRAARRHPTLEPVGWWRSHSRGRPRYSPLDCAERASYPGGQDVAIVVAAEQLGRVAAHGDRQFDALGVYVGCEPTLLARRPRGTVPPAELPVEARASEPLGRSEGGAQRSAAGADEVRSIDTRILIAIAVVVASGFLVAGRRERSAARGGSHGADARS